MFTSKTGALLDAVYGIDKHGKPETVALSSPSGISLSDAQEQMITNSKFFEAGASMSLLKHPWMIGEVFDQHALHLATLLRHGLSENSVAGGLPVYTRGESNPWAMC